MATVTLEQFNPANFEPIPLPDHLPTYELPRVSISKLMGKDEAETKTVVDICARTGFFLLNLMDHPLGRNLWESACKLRNLGQHIMATLPEEDKKLFLQREERGVLDRGYTSSARDGQGVAKFVESINIPRDELFAKPTPGWELPSWLKPHEDLFKNIQTEAHKVELVILAALEQQLELKPGTFTDTHQLEAPTHSFLRVLRYPPTGDGNGMRERPRVFAHRDVVSISMLFTWVSGLQIPRDDAVYLNSDTPTEDSWLWVRPEAGHMIVNLGDTMPIFTNGALKSGLHRVVTAHGDQANLDRVSVLFTGRPNWGVPMAPLVSSKIPAQSAEEAARPADSCKVWGDNVIKGYYKDNVKWNKAEVSV
ncbi:uncharacterized protein TRUGW13939_10408 [Talaromyces rugulosus]|uniref:Fe2OG dioxygenase domain-containing protein n=1 Tax=Talaromyces rugulosus TaxID=121627 RepID=A0A7H8R9Y1_TALRU|nr:uncharacterized protein TRUGW13939_10408 [Talaromyces rugulosus]QKX63239.1 hypothetical protein TRUGW13939_10408 [Talaromyces rugulosus]